MWNPCAHAYFSIFLPSSQHLPPVPIPPLFLSLFGLGAPEATPKALKELDVASKRHSDKTSFVRFKLLLLRGDGAQLFCRTRGNDGAVRLGCGLDGGVDSRAGATLRNI